MVSPADAFRILREADALLKDEGEIRLFTELLEFKPPTLDQKLSPDEASFLKLDEVLSQEPDALLAQLSSIVRRTPLSRAKRGLTERTGMFQEVITLVYSLAGSFRIELCHVDVESGKEHEGFLERLRKHHEQSHATHARSLAMVPAKRIAHDVTMARVLIKTWQGFGELCCNDDVIGHVSDNATAPQLIYMCLKPL